MSGLRDISLGELGRAIARYQPVVAAITAILLIVVFVPGRDDTASGARPITAGTPAPSGAPRTPGAGQGAPTAPGSPSAAAAPSGASGAQPSGSGGSGAASSAVAAPAGDPGAPVTGGQQGETAAAPTAPEAGGAAAAPGEPLPVASDATTNPNCDPATGRIKIPSVYAPPCRPVFDGDNGGATWQGVTDKEILIAFYKGQSYPGADVILRAAGVADTNEDVQKTIDDYVDFFEKHFEVYGRKMRGVIVEASGPDGDDAAAKADAVKVATEIKAFASMGGPLLTNRYAEELAARGVMCFCLIGQSNEFLAKQHPYVWMLGPVQEQAFLHWAEYMGKRLWGQPAKHAGDPTFHLKQRTFGLMHIDTAEGAAQPGVRVFEQEIAKYGAFLTDKVSYTLDIPRAQEQSRVMIARMKDKGVTTIIPATDFIYPIFFTQEATKQQYFPEWYCVGAILTDVSAFARLYDQQQWSHCFGVSVLAARAQPELGDAFRLHVWHHGRPPQARASYGVIYGAMILFYLGLHMGGPRLTPETYRDGLYSYPPSGGGITTVLLSWGFHGFWEFEDYGMWEDCTEIWWDRNARGRDEFGQDGFGLYRYVDGGKRYNFTKWPTTEPKAFVVEGTVTVYDEIPPSDTPPEYEHQPH